MSFRTIAVFGCLAVAAGAPLLLSEKDKNDVSKPGTSPFAFASSPDADPSTQPIVLPPVEFNEPLFNVVPDFREIFNFNITPAWVQHRWPRISVCSGEDDLQGMRVALVTGPMQHDIHGSLTYYFDSNNKLQRITFKGWSGDSKRLEQLVTRDFQFGREKSNALGYYIVKEWGKPKGVLRLDRPPVIDRNLANQQVTMLLEINRPGGNTSLSQQTQRIIDSIN